MEPAKKEHLTKEQQQVVDDEKAATARAHGG
jgi:hypothetical protein